MRWNGKATEEVQQKHSLRKSFVFKNAPQNREVESWKTERDRGGKSGILGEKFQNAGENTIAFSPAHTCTSSQILLTPAANLQMFPTKGTQQPPPSPLPPKANPPQSTPQDCSPLPPFPVLPMS